MEAASPRELDPRGAPGPPWRRYNGALPGLAALVLAGCAVSGGAGPAGAAAVPRRDAHGADAALDVAPDATHSADLLAGEVADASVVCPPSCPLASCDAEDGCGGLCPPCPSEQSCEGCPLRLHVAERDDPFLRVALDFEPAAGASLPTLADLRLRVEGDATLLELEVGEAVLEADKAPFPDPETGAPFQVHALGDGAQLVRVVLGSASSTSTMGAGHWLTWRFRLGGAFTPLEAPVVMRLLTDEPLFAPPAAEQQLWGSDVDGAVVLWPAEVR